MKLFTKILLLSILLLNQQSVAQRYAPPVDFKILLSGTFGELRSNHFHTGIDIKTKGVEGHEIKAIADGYISRIKVSSWGYGKTIYLTHPQTGHTSVYAHLQKFSSKIDSLVIKEHYKKEKFEIDFFPKRRLLIKQGEVIALSGNSGSSAGAHLHFEIRDTKSEKPINPLHLGFKVKDDISPTLVNLKIYAFDTTLIDGYNKDKIYPVKKNNNTYSLKKTPTINGAFGLGIYTYDKGNDSYNKNGIYSIKLSIDNILYYEFKVDTLNFSTKRYINAHIDYFEKKETNKKYHKCYKVTNNRLNNYPIIINDGIINFDDTITHKIKLEVSDIYNNNSTLNFNVKATNNPFLLKCPIIKNSKLIAFKLEKPNIFKTDNFTIHMKPYSLYEDISLNYQTTDSIEGVFGLVHNLHKNTVPVHKKYILSIKTNVPDSLKNKVYIATTDMKGNFWYLGGTWKQGFLRSKVREFGNFCVVADTTKPEIRGLNIFNGKELNNQTNIKCIIKDKHSGINKYRAEIDGKWILMEYDHKRNLLQFNINNSLTRGEHIFTLQVIDNVGNEKIYTNTFNY
tara:strand:+ start:531 stop:2228 length:1698 start_codon:yes stop_codon:yes gene_type:complete